MPRFCFFFLFALRRVCEMTSDQLLVQLLQQKDLPLYTILIIYLYMKFNDLSDRLSRLEAKFSMIEKHILKINGGGSDEEATR